MLLIGHSLSTNGPLAHVPANPRPRSQRKDDLYEGGKSRSSVRDVVRRPSPLEFSSVNHSCVCPFTSSTIDSDLCELELAVSLSFRQLCVCTSPPHRLIYTSASPPEMTNTPASVRPNHMQKKQTTSSHPHPRPKFFDTQNPTRSRLCRYTRIPSSSHSHKLQVLSLLQDSERYVIIVRTTLFAVELVPIYRAHDTVTLNGGDHSDVY